MPIRVEVCISSIEAAQIAQFAGADRLELNTALELDGLSPTPGLLMGVMENVNLPVICMARPRGGNFYYSESEWKILKEDAAWMLDMGASGIAVGCLTADNEIDQARLGEIRELAGNRELVFHLAFDQVPDWKAAVDVLANHRINRLMTRGRASTAVDGLTQIREIIGYAGNRIEVLPAGRIGSANARQVVEETGCVQLHGSFSSGIAPALTMTDRFQALHAEIDSTIQLFAA